MATLNVEVGTAAPNSNAYISTDDFSNLMIDDPDTSKWAILTVDQQINYIVMGASYLDKKFRFYGLALTQNQGMQWPRTKNFDSKGFVIPRGTIPWEIKYANAKLALYALTEEGLFNTVEETGLVKRFQTEGLQVDFDPKAAASAAIEGKRFPEIELLLKNLGQFKDIEWFSERRTEPGVFTQ